MPSIFTRLQRAWKKFRFMYLKHQKEQLTVDFIDYQRRIDDKKTVEIPKIIWIFWHSERPNTLVDICIQRIRYFCHDFDIHILNFDTVEQYIGQLPKFHADLPIANISDYIRLALLKQYGGVYLDASILLTENLDWILEKITNHDAFVFYTDACTTDLNYPIVENWCIIAPQNSIFILKWFEEYQRCLLSESPDQYYEYLLEDKVFLQKLNNVVYLKCYVSAMIVLGKDSFNLLYARSGSVGHYYNYKYLGKPEYIAISLLKKPKKYITIPKLIKFTADSREYVELYMQKNDYNPKSILGEILNVQK